jgi:flagellar hook-length control protein FliK
LPGAPSAPTSVPLPEAAPRPSPAAADPGREPLRRADASRRAASAPARSTAPVARAPGEARAAARATPAVETVAPPSALDRSAPPARAEAGGPLAVEAGAGPAPDAPRSSEPAPARGELRALPELPLRNEVELVRQTQLLARGGGGSIALQLSPPELGGLHLRVSVREGVVRIALRADQAPVAELLARHTPELRQALEAQGLRLEQLDIGTPGPQADAGGGDAARGDAATDQRPPRPAPLRARADAAGPAPGLLRAAGTGTVDIRV